MCACHTECAYTHTHTKARWITVSFITPQGAILCTTEIWRIPSLINVEAAPINIFISAYAPCWKRIQGDFKLYELISYLLRQLSMPTPTSPSSPYIFSSHSPPPHMLISFPPFFFFFPPFLHTAEMGLERSGVHAAANESRGLKVPVPFQSFSLGKVWAKKPTHSLKTYNMIRRLAHIW